MTLNIIRCENIATNRGNSIGKIEISAESLENRFEDLTMMG